MRNFRLRGRLADIALPVILGLAFVAVLAGGAKAGVATSGAVLLDPFDPVPEIQFRHFGGYGDWGGGYGSDRYRHCKGDDCARGAHCDREDGCRDGDPREAELANCDQKNCYYAEHYERRWHNGDQVGTEWMDRGRREKTVTGTGRPRDWDSHDNNWHDEDEDFSGGGGRDYGGGRDNGGPPREPH